VKIATSRDVAITDTGRCPRRPFNAPALAAAMALRLIISLVFLGIIYSEALAAVEPPRIALVIGNAAYSAPLRNPRNDAKAVAKMLKGLGFEVLEYTDLGLYGMRKAISDFGDKLKNGGIGLFYYSGHGVALDGNNFLVPVDASIKYGEAVYSGAINLSTIVDKLPKGDNALNIIILDACRNNPFEVRTRGLSVFGGSSNRGSGGLGEFKAPTGTLIAYATAPNEVASDGEGDHSPYTQALLQVLPKPNLTVEEVFKQVRVKVIAATKNDPDGKVQTPWENSSLTGNFYFNRNRYYDTVYIYMAAPLIFFALIIISFKYMLRRYFAFSGLGGIFSGTTGLASLTASVMEYTLRVANRARAIARSPAASHVACRVCHGSGSVKAMQGRVVRPCQVCHGKGMLFTCGACKGSGKRRIKEAGALVEHTCADCRGQGTVAK